MSTRRPIVDVPSTKNGWHEFFQKQGWTPGPLSVRARNGKPEFFCTIIKDGALKEAIFIGDRLVRIDTIHIIERMKTHA